MVTMGKFRVEKQFRFTFRRYEQDFEAKDSIYFRNAIHAWDGSLLQYANVLYVQLKGIRR